MSLVGRKEILNILISFVFTDEHSSVLDLGKARRIQHCMLVVLKFSRNFVQRIEF